MKDHAHLIISLIGVTITLVTIIAAFANAFDRVALHQISIEDHGKRLNAIERDKTTDDKLNQLQKSIDYATWRIDALSKDFDKTTSKGNKR